MVPSGSLDIPIEALFFPALVAWIIGNEIYSRARRKRLTAEWASLVEKRGWQLIGAHPLFEVHAVVRGIQVSLRHVEHIGGKGARSYSHLVTGRPATALGGLAVTHASLVDRIFPSGEAEIDQGLRLSGENRGALRVPGREALRAVPDAIIKDGAVHLWRTGIAEPGDTEEAFLVVAKIASEIDR